MAAAVAVSMTLTSCPRVIGFMHLIVPGNILFGCSHQFASLDCKLEPSPNSGTCSLSQNCHRFIRGVGWIWSLRHHTSPSACPSPCNSLDGTDLL